METLENFLAEFETGFDVKDDKLVQEMNQKQKDRVIISHPIITKIIILLTN